MFLKQFIEPNLALCSYFLADVDTRDAFVVDPQPDTSAYLDLASEHNFTIKYIFLTHYASEFVAGHEKLSKATGAQIAISNKAKAEFEFLALTDGYSIEHGKLRLVAEHTPGHTDESICLLVYDLDVSSQEPVSVLTGDTLYKGDCGRPDLLATDGHSTTYLAGALYDSLESRLRRLPGDTKVYPGHAYGSVSPEELSTGGLASTIEEEWSSNFAFHAANREDFVELITAYAPVSEETGPALVGNRGGQPQSTGTLARLKPLDAGALEQLEREGAIVIDFRSIQQFAGAHVRGSINLPAFANLSFLEDLVHRPVIVVSNPGEENQALEVLIKAKFNSVVGYLQAGMGAQGLSPEIVGQLRRLTARDLLEQLESASPPLLVDVRPASKWQSDGFLNSINTPFSQFSDHARHLASHDRIVVYCEEEFHSGVAASILQHRGFDHVSSLIGGMGAWRRLKSQLGSGALFVRSHA